jgi:hypothetical protein
MSADASRTQNWPAPTAAAVAAANTQELVRVLAGAAADAAGAPAARWQTDDCRLLLAEHTRLSGAAEWTAAALAA